MRIVTSKIKLIYKHSCVFSYALSAIVTMIVYFTGGTNTAFTNLMYLPIAIVASTNGKIQGMVHAVISALLVGPFMPLDVAANLNQNSLNWIFRLAIYAIIALVIGFFADYYKQEFEKSKQKDEEILESQLATIYSLVKLAESRDDQTGSHIERVAIFCKLLANNLRNNQKYQSYITDDYVEQLFKASPLHDIGKVGIPDSILLKPGKLSPAEFEIMKAHTTIGANTLSEVKKRYPDNKLLELGIKITHSHHEKWDGTGYPQGLSGTEIPLSARIMALADVYDALRSKRVYKEAYPHQASLAIIKQGKGTFFDPEIVDAFLEIEAEFEATFDQYNKYNQYNLKESKPVVMERGGTFPLCQD